METENSKKDIYTIPRIVNNLDECSFYHYMDIPGEEVITGKWDLRDGVDQYLGGVNFKGKRVLELGTASGFLCFEMEKRGAEVIACDIGEDQEWDMVPFCQYDYKKHIEEFKEYTSRLKNAYWYAHKAYNSEAKVIYCPVYEIPEEISTVDIATFCAILLHLRDPFRALQSALRLVRETVIVTDLAPSRSLVALPSHPLMQVASIIKRFLFSRQKTFNEYKVPYMELLPDFRTLVHKDVWWSLSPEIIIKFLGILGFEKTKVTYHSHGLYGKKTRLFTVVGKRTKDTELVQTIKID